MGTSAETMHLIDKNKSALKEPWYSPFRLFPNVSKFEVRIGDWDPLFELHGMKKRINTELWAASGHNRRLNQYMLHQLRRLTGARLTNNSKLF